MRRSDEHQRLGYILFVVTLGAGSAQAGPLTEAKVDLTQYAPQQARASQDGDVAVALAIAGGGLRAANFGVGVMLGMEQVATTRGDLLGEVDYVSTISGGGFAAAVWLASRHDHEAGEAPYRLAKVVAPGQPYREALTGGYTGKLFRAGCEVHRASRHRGHSLEKLFDERPLGAAGRGRSLTMGDVWQRAGSPARPDRMLPYWVPNAGLAENGALLPFAPNVMASARIDGYVHGCRDEVNQDPYAMPLSVGMKASASFPGGLPGTVLRSSLNPHRPYVRLTDGGVSDNQGIITAVEMLRSEPAQVSRKVLVVVDAYRGDDLHPFSEDGQPFGDAVDMGRSVYLLKNAQRLNYKRLVAQLCEAAGIGFVYIEIGAVPDVALARRIRDVPTGFTVSAQQQADLLEGGRQALGAKLGELRAAGVPR